MNSEVFIEKLFELTGHSAAIYSFDFFPDSPNYIYTASGDGFIARWDLLKQQQDSFSVRLNSSSYVLKCIEATNYLIAGLSNGDIHVIDVLNKKEIAHLKYHTTGIFGIQHNKKNAHLYISDAIGNLSIWNSENFKFLMSLPLNCGKIRHIELIDEGSKIVVSCQNGFVKIFETSYYNEILEKKISDQGINFFINFPLKKEIGLIGGKDGLLRLVSLRNLEELFNFPAHNYAVYQASFHPDASCFVSVSRDKSIKIWNSSNLSLIKKIERPQGGHTHSINSVKWISNEKLVTIGDDKRIVIWGINNIFV
jgi:WD40 repeat protein